MSCFLMEQPKISHPDSLCSPTSPLGTRELAEIKDVVEKKLVNLCFVFLLHLFSWRCEQIKKLLKKKKGSMQEGGFTIGPWELKNLDH